MSQEDKFNFVKAEPELMQKQMDKYDDMAAKIKTWAITLFAALLGWSFQIERKEVLLLSTFILLVFWALDAVNKNFRQDYKKRRDEIAKAFQAFFQTASWPDDFIAPDLPVHRSIEAFKNFLKPHTSLFYVPLIVVALIIFFVV